MNCALTFLFVKTILTKPVEFIWGHATQNLTDENKKNLVWRDRLKKINVLFHIDLLYSTNYILNCFQPLTEYTLDILLHILRNTRLFSLEIGFHYSIINEACHFSKWVIVDKSHLSCHTF